MKPLYLNNSVVFLLFFLFVLALIIRFLYFPQNIYFGFDQARDAFVVQEILQGDLKTIGPPTAISGLHHGVFYYYLYAPIYLLFQGNPEAVAAFLRIINAVGVFVIFFIGTALFNKLVGVISALLYAFSFEQTQYALYFNHPALAILSVMIFYLGLIQIFFRHNQKGLMLFLLGLGLSLQFEFFLIYLFFISLIMIMIFRKNLPQFNFKTIVLALVFFFLVVSTFFISVIKFQSWQFFQNTPSIILPNNFDIQQLFSNLFLISSRFVQDNIFSFGSSVYPLTFIGAVFLWLMKNKSVRMKLIFLLIWFTAGILPYLNNQSASPLYYYSVGASIALLIFVSFCLKELFSWSKILGAVLLVVIIFSNLNLIIKFNPQGPIPTINVQSGMLLADEKRVVDYMYQQAAGQPFAVNVLTMPLYVNTTWSYLFEWYGKKHGYLHVWSGKAASGYHSKLYTVSDRTTLPPVQFLVIEPTRGIREGLINQFLQEEDYFSKVITEERIGQFVIQKRTIR